MTENKKIAGVVILYNPDDEVLKNINSYITYVEQLFVIDNSDKENTDLISKIKSFTKVHYIRNNGNLGIARALNIGCNSALKAGYNWILTMDQDSCFLSGDFFDLVKNEKEDNIGIYAASYTNVYDRWVKPHNQNFNNIHFVVTSANVVNLNVWKEVGEFEEKLFIDEVDHDFCIKIRKAGYLIVTTKNIFLTHSVGLKLTSKIKSDKVFEGHSPIRYYYITRNTLYITKKYFFSDFTLVYNRQRHFLKNFIRIILFYPQKLQYLGFILKGLSDFLFGRYGKLIIKK